MNAARIAWLVGAIGAALCLAGAILQPAPFAFAWLAALTAWLGWPLGCLALLLIHALTGGRWGIVIRTWLLLGTSLLWLLLPAVFVKTAALL